MLQEVRKALDYLREKQVLHRLGVLLSLTVIAVAFYVLYHMVRDIHVGKLIRALRETDLRDVAFAALFVAGGYFTLTFYDLFALRAIGRLDVPYRIAALAGFTSYSVGHNVGASVFSGGAVRYRIYSAWNLDAVEVAKICFIAGLTFWLGNAAVLGLGIFYHPDAASAVDRLPAWFNRGVSVIVIAALVAYIVWVWIKPRQVGRGPWTVMLPGGPLTLLQIAIGIVDLGCCAMAMYMVLPDQPAMDFITLAVIFVSATLLGFASHSPGGLGVFDLAMLAALLHFDREELIAGLLLFRVLYYIVPFVLSLLILATREAIVALHRRRRLKQALDNTPLSQG